MERLRIELEIAEHDVNFVIINAYTALEQQAKLTQRCSMPLLQDLDTIKVWDMMGGKKDDFFIYDKSGKLLHYLPVNGEISVNLSTDEGYENLKGLVLEALE